MTTIRPPNRTIDEGGPAAYVEIMLAVGAGDKARSASDELAEIAGHYQGRVLAAQARGAVEHGKKICAMAVCYTGDLARTGDVLAPIRAICDPIMDLLAERPYTRTTCSAPTAISVPMSEGVDVDAFVRFEAEGWSRVPEGYHRFFGSITGRAMEPLLDAAGVGVGTRVLDVATGPGYLAGRAAARGASVVGVDFAPEILALAADLNPAVEFRRGDAHDLPFEDCSFDAVVSGFLLPHLGNHARAMGELVRVLTSRGRLAVSTWDLPERTAIPGLLHAAVQEAGADPPAGLPAGPPFFQYSADDALIGLLRSAGLGDVEIDRLAFTHRLPSATALWDGLLAGTVRAAPLVGRQPEPVQRRIRASFDALAARYHTGGSLELPVSIKLASGQKPSGTLVSAGR